MEPVDYLRILKNHWKVVVALVLIAASAVYLVSPKEASSRYRAQHVLVLESSSGEEEAAATIANVQVAALRVEDGQVPVRAARILGHEGDEAALAGVAARLADDVEATGDRDLQTVSITATATDPSQAVRIANAFALALAEFVDDAESDRRTREVDEPSQRIAEIEQRLSDVEYALLGRVPAESAAALHADQSRLSAELVRLEAELEAVGSPVRYGTLAEATSAEAETSFFSTREQRMLLAAGVALILGFGVAVALDRNDSRLRTKEQVEQTFGLPVLAEVPLLPFRDRDKGAVEAFEREPRVAEAYRSLRTALSLFRGVGDGPANGDDHLRQLVVVTSSEPGEGKSSTAANLAMAYAEAGHTVLILGWDLWRPLSPEVLGATDGPGVTDYLAEDEPVLDGYIQHTSIPRVTVVPAGTRREGGGASGRREAAGKLLDEARIRADVVIVDTAPLLSVSMTGELATLADAVVVVCRAGRTTTEAARRCAELLERVGAPALGVVMVGVPTGGFADYYGPARKTAYDRAPGIRREPVVAGAPTSTSSTSTQHDGETAGAS